MKRFLFISAFALLAFALPASGQTIVNQFSTGGSFAGGLEYDAATDTIWLADSTADMIFRYEPERVTPAHELRRAAGPRPSASAWIPVTGNLWVGDESEYVDELDPHRNVPTGRAWPTTPTITDVSGVAVDPVTGQCLHLPGQRHPDDRRVRSER